MQDSQDQIGNEKVKDRYFLQMEKFCFTNFDHMPLKRCIEVKFVSIWYLGDGLEKGVLS